MTNKTLLSLVSCSLSVSLAWAQNPPSVSQVLMFSTVSDRAVRATPGTPFVPSSTGTIPQALFTVYTNAVRADPGGDLNTFVTTINGVPNYNPAVSNLSSALSSNIAVALSTIPLASPTSAVILKTDSTTGAPLPSSTTLGPIFTQRAETVGRGKFYLGVSHQSYHFTSLYGQSLNGLSVMYTGGDTSGVINPNTGRPATTAPATFNMGLDVRLSQNIAFLTYGVSNRFDVSVGFPQVHASVAASSYNGIVYSGSGVDFNPGNQCWCVNTLTPGTFELSSPVIGRSSLSKTGFGDMIFRFKGTVASRRHYVLAAGADLRVPTGDAENFLGLGTTAIKPFAALSLYSNPLFGKIVFAPHVDVGWQVAGKSILNGQMQGTQQFATLQNGTRVPYFGLPIVQTKDTLPDILTWSIGTEIGLGNRNTVVLDVVGNQVGMLNNAQLLRSQARATSFAAPSGSGIIPQSSGLVDGGRGSFGQYSGAFGYKVKIAGGLVATFQALVRFDNNALTARVSPLYGLGYSF